jgi:hypothetical protein
MAVSSGRGGEFGKKMMKTTVLVKKEPMKMLRKDKIAPSPKKAIPKSPKKKGFAK